MVSEPGFTKLLTVLLIYSVYFGLYNGALIPLLADIMPHEVRIAGFSLAFVTATAVFGGFTPAICTYLIEVTGNRAAPSVAAICGRNEFVCSVGASNAGLPTARVLHAALPGSRCKATDAGRRSGTVIRAASGNFLELYDYLVYVYFAGYIAKAYFPARSEFMSLLLALGTYGVASFARPFGAVVLGSYMDRVGRRKGSAADFVADGGGNGFGCHHPGLFEHRIIGAIDYHCRDVWFRASRSASRPVE